VDILYDAAIDLLYRPHPYLVIVEEEENDTPCLSGDSGEKEAVTPTYSYSDDDSEIFCTPPMSLTANDEVSKNIVIRLSLSNNGIQYTVIVT
jgi:hypothetical protein